MRRKWNRQRCKIRKGPGHFLTFAESAYKVFLL